MLSNLWDNLLYEPLLNALAFFIHIVPNGDVGLAVIALTILVKILLFPISQKSINAQAKMSLLAPEIKKIQKSSSSKEEQAKKTFELYKQHKVNPFSGCLLLIIQIPIIFALYYVFYKGINFETGLYSFSKVPENMNMMFLGILDIGHKSLFLAILAGISQFFQAYFMPKNNTSTGDPNSFSESFAKSMQVQMKYVFPFVVGFIAYTVSGAVALYIVISNIFAIGQQFYVKHRKDKNMLITTAENHG